MTEMIQATDITLADLETKFGLQLVETVDFFPEWQDDLPEISHSDELVLDRVKKEYFNLIKYPPLLEDTIKMVILSPLLSLAGFYLQPFWVKSEVSFQLADVDETISLKGKIDILILKNRLWVMVIEAKRPAYSIEAGLAQILAYMLANPEALQPSFGLITTGGSFAFIKLVKRDRPQYSLSQIFELRNPGNDLHKVLRILKKLGDFI